MANITREIAVNVPPAQVWAQVKDLGNTHRLFAGVLTDCKLEDGARVVTFANGMVVRELIVDVNDDLRRVAYAAVGGRTTHHNASLQVLPGAAGGSTVLWTTDFLPDSVAPGIAGLVDAGAAALKRNLEG